MSNHDREDSRPSNRDADLERAWRETSTEQPPAHLDAAIIAAARRTVPGRGERPDGAPVRIPSRNWLTRWQSLVAAAAVASLAFVLVPMLPREQDLAPSMQSQGSAQESTSAEPQPPISSADKANDYRQTPRTDENAGQRERGTASAPAPAQSVVPAPPTTPAPPAAKAEATASDSATKAGTAATLSEVSADRRKSVESAVSGRAAATAAAAPSSPAREEALGNPAPLDATAWAARIAALHASGDVTAAGQALREFRAADPDADTYLPDSLRDWARSVD